MDTNITNKPSNKPTSSSNTVPIRLSKSTARILKSLVTKCNRKPYGRKVKADDVIYQALSLIGNTQLEEIKEATYSSQDKLEIEFKKYCQTNGNISKDEFLQLLLNRALPQASGEEISEGSEKESEGKLLSGQSLQPEN